MPIQPKQQPPYYTPAETKQYTALITQTGTEPPTIIELINTIGSIVWTYIDVGIYRGTLTAAFTTQKTYVMINNSTSGAFISAFDAENTNYIEINTLDAEQAAANGLLNLTSLDIKVFS